MADNDQDKTEHQSQKRLEQSREKGELPRSQELGTFVVFAVFISYFAMTRSAWLDGLGGVMSDMLQFDRHMGLGRQTLGEFLLTPVLRAAAIMAPPLVLVLLASPMTTLCQTRFNIAHNKLAPDWSRLDPAAGLARIFNKNQVVEGLKNSIKICVFSWLAWSAIIGRIDQVKVLGTLDLRQQVAVMCDLALAIGIRVAILMAALATLDLGWQWWTYIQKMRMSNQEMKEETKDRDGNPLIKQRQRSLQMQAARQRMMSDVKHSTVVVMNPTHFAVALRYDVEKAPAPYVVAKGSDEVALRIKAIAREAGVPVVENKPLARALYRKARVGKVIPSEFFRAVAEVLAFIYLLKRNRESRAARHSPIAAGRRWV